MLRLLPHRQQLVRAAQALGAGFAAALFLGCSPAGAAQQHGAGPDGAQRETAPSSALEGELSVYAAASLTAAFEEIAAEFTEAHPATSVALSFDGSATLATQIIGGAPAEVFASADEANMEQLEDANVLAATPNVFASNTLMIAVAPGNPFGIASLADLPAPDQHGSSPLVVTCAVQVPCGAAAHTLLTRDSIALTPASEELSVTAVLTKVVEGEADAGLVYATDVQAAAGKVEGIEIASAEDAAGRYVIAPVAGAADADLATAFTAFVLSPAGQAVLASYGFTEGR